MSMQYLTVAEFKLLSSMPEAEIDALESVAPGWLDQNLITVSGRINSQLRKRYAVPFASPHPDTVRLWLAQLVTPLAYLRLGINPLDKQQVAIEKVATTAQAEIKEAADAVEGLYDLPLRSDTDESGLAAPNTRVYSEASPFVAFDLQRETATFEDSGSNGTEF